MYQPDAATVGRKRQPYKFSIGRTSHSRSFVVWLWLLLKSLGHMIGRTKEFTPKILCIQPDWDKLHLILVYHR